MAALGLILLVVGLILWLTVASALGWILLIVGLILFLVGLLLGDLSLDGHV